MSLKKIRTIAVALVLVLIAGSFGYRQGQLTERRVLSGKSAVVVGEKVQNGVDLTLFWDVWTRLQKYYLDQKAVDVQKMVYGAIRGMTASLDDPYTAFLAPSENDRTKQDLSGEFGGVGIQLGFVDKTLGVMAPLSGSPAEKVGVKAGDLILKIIDKEKGIDKETQGMSLTEAMDLIRGKQGTKVILVMLHKDETATREVEIVREVINVPSVELKWVDEGRVAWFRVYRFGDKTKTEWDSGVTEILARKAKPGFRGIVLDLRNNPGGYLRGAVELASEFVKDGVVVQQQGKDKTEKFAALGEARLLKIPLVVLVNQGSASASEILAGTLRERLGVKLVGEKTFGKGTVQEAQELIDGAGLHVTIARWLLPSGRNIHGDGLVPDVEVKYEQKDNEPEFDNQLEKAVEVL